MKTEKQFANEQHMKIVAEKLNGREYGYELTDEEADQLKSVGLVVAFGYSDDNVEFRGAFNDEVGYYEEGEVLFANGDILCAPCDLHEECTLWKNAVKAAASIKFVFSVNGLIFKTDIPHEKFVVMDEDGAPFGEGIVFAYEDIGGKLK